MYTLEFCQVQVQVLQPKSKVCFSIVMCQTCTVQYKILEKENFVEFGEMQEIRHNFLIKNFPFYKSW